MFSCIYLKGSREGYGNLFPFLNSYGIIHYRYKTSACKGEDGCKQKVW